LAELTDAVNVQHALLACIEHVGKQLPSLLVERLVDFPVEGIGDLVSRLERSLVRVQLIAGEDDLVVEGSTNLLQACRLSLEHYLFPLALGFRLRLLLCADTAVLRYGCGQGQHGQDCTSHLTPSIEVGLRLLWLSLFSVSLARGAL